MRQSATKQHASAFFSTNGRIACLIGACLTFTTLGAVAKTVEVSGEFLFPPSMGDTEACNFAEQRAKQDALRQVLGERVSVSEQLSCREGGAATDDKNCVYDNFVWSEIDGDIKRAERLKTNLPESTLGGGRCSVVMRVEVDVPAVLPDPGFDFDASLDPIRVRSKDSIVFLLKPSTSMHMAIFGWAPTHDRALVSRIYPNQFESSGLLKPKESRRIPSKEAEGQYSFQVAFPADIKQDFVDEYLIFVATKTPVAWLESYDFDQFKKRLREISPPDKRVVKQSYRIIR